MERRKKTVSATLAWGFGLAAIAGPGCRSRDLQVPPVPRYSDQGATAPGPGPALGQATDPYDGLNPYADANLGSLPAVDELPTGAAPISAGSPYGPATAAPSPSYDPAGATPPPMPDPTLPPSG